MSRPDPYYVKLRPHHLLCNICFRGKGYNEEFVENFLVIQKKIFNSEAKIKIVSGCDDICAKCPKKVDPSCDCRQSAIKLDEDYLSVLQLKVGQVITFEDLMSRIKRFLTIDRFKSICSKCQWYPLNICSSVLKSIILNSEVY